MQRSQQPPPPKKKKSFPEKHLKLFQIKIIFNNDFKESVKVTNIFRNAISANQEHYIFKSFQVSMPPDPPRRPPKHFSRRRVAENFFSGLTPQTKKSKIELWLPGQDYILKQ